MRRTWVSGPFRATVTSATPIAPNPAIREAIVTHARDPHHKSLLRYVSYRSIGRHNLLHVTRGMLRRILPPSLVSTSFEAFGPAAAGLRRVDFAPGIHFALDLRHIIPRLHVGRNAAISCHGLLSRVVSRQAPVGSRLCKVPTDTSDTLRRPECFQPDRRNPARRSAARSRASIASIPARPWAKPRRIVVAFHLDHRMQQLGRHRLFGGDALDDSAEGVVRRRLQWPERLLRGRVRRRDHDPHQFSRSRIGPNHRLNARRGRFRRQPPNRTPLPANAAIARHKTNRIKMFLPSIYTTSGRAVG